MESVSESAALSLQSISRFTLRAHPRTATPALHVWPTREAQAAREVSIVETQQGGMVLERAVRCRSCSGPCAEADRRGEFVAALE
eukprot:1066598-Rhodomonas_salina.1